MKSMKKSGLQIASGILEIILGAFSVIRVMLLFTIGKLIGLSLNPLGYILCVTAFVYIWDGILYCARKSGLGAVISTCLLNLCVIILELVAGFLDGFSAMSILTIGLGAVVLVLFLMSIVEVYNSIDKTNKKELEAVIVSQPVASETGNTGPVNNPASENLYLPVDEATHISGPATALLNLKELFDAGILTAEEYAGQKMNLLQKLFG